MFFALLAKRPTMLLEGVAWSMHNVIERIVPMSTVITYGLRMAGNRLSTCPSVITDMVYWIARSR